MKKIFLTVCLVANCLFASAQQWLTPEVESRGNELLSKMTVDEKLSYIVGTDWMYTKNIDRLGINRMKMTDGPQGLGTHGKSTAYPATISLAATFNEDLAYNYGEALGRDCKARGINILLGPAVNIYRAAMCGRNFEYMGEDPYLAGRIAAGYIKGVQAQGVMATIKHFIANNSDYDRDHISNDMDERTMHEIYLPAFKTAVQDAEVACLMTSYNLVNGIYTTESPELLRNILRDQWGFKGLVMSDWGSSHFGIPAVKGGMDLEMPGGAVRDTNLKYYLRTGDITMEMIDEKVLHILRVLVAFDCVDGTKADTSIPEDDPRSAALALKVAQEGVVLLKNARNILPLSTHMKKIVVTGNNAKGYVYGGGSGKVTPFHYVDMLGGITAEAQKHGIAVEYVDELDFLDEIIFTKDNEVGLLAEYYDNIDLKGNPVHTAVEKKVNYGWSDGTGIKGMPGQKFSVRWTGVVRPKISGNYDFSLGGDDGYRLYFNEELIVDDWKNGGFRTAKFTKQLQAGQEYKIRIEYYQDGGGAAVSFIWKQQNSNKNAFVDYLNKADVVIACIGHNSESEGEGRDRTFAPSEVDVKLLSSLENCRKPVVAVVNAGGNLEMQSWEPRVEGLLWAWYAGQEAGTAVADILFGNVNPSGKLPMTFEKKWEDNPAYNSYYDPDGDKHVKYSEGIFIGYRGYDKLNREVQYPFGYGLSYTTFKLSNLTVGTQQEDGSVEISYQLANTGKRAGAQVVQTYVGRVGGLIARPEKELKGFKKVFLNPGETVTVQQVLPKDAFTYYCTIEKDFIVDGGDYNVMLGFSSRDIKAQKTIEIK